MAVAAAAASPVASKAASAFEAVVAVKSSAAASPFSALASASGLGAYETIQSPSEISLKPPGFSQKRGGRRSSLRVSDLMTFTPDQSLRPEGPPRSVRRSTRLSGVKKDYKV